MYTYLGKNKLLSFKVNTEVNTALMLINIYILIKHNVFQNYKKANKQTKTSSPVSEIETFKISHSEQAFVSESKAPLSTACEQSLLH